MQSPISTSSALERPAPTDNGAPLAARHAALPPARSPFDYPAWLIDLDGTLYRQRIVRSMMAVEVLILGRSSITILKAFRQEHERIRAYHRRRMRTHSRCRFARRPIGWASPKTPSPTSSTSGCSPGRVSGCKCFVGAGSLQ